MRVAVVGATGRIGRLTVPALERRGHETVAISRGVGVDVHAGHRLVDALNGGDAVIDPSSTDATDRDEVVDSPRRTSGKFLGCGTAGTIESLVDRTFADNRTTAPGG